MPVKIRLSRMGCRHQPHYRITVANSWAKRDGRHIEQIGSYNPMPDAQTGAKLVQLDFDRAKYWLGVGAQPTDTVARLLGKVLKGGDVSVYPLTYARLGSCRASLEAPSSMMHSLATIYSSFH